MTYNRARDVFLDRITSPDLSAPPRGGFAVTPGAVELATYARALYVGGAGDVVVVMTAEGNDAAAVTFTDVPGGSILPVQVRRVLSATTATGIVALY